MKFIKNFIKDKEFGLLSLIKELIAICVLFPLLYSFCNADSFVISGLSSMGTNFSISTNNFNSTLVRSVSYNGLTGNYYICVSEEYYNSSAFNSDVYFYECTASKSQSTNLANDSACTNLKTITKGTSLNNMLLTDMECFQTSQSKYYYFSRDTTGTNASSVQFGLSFINTDILRDYFGNSSSCPSCPSQYTSLECQTEYNLIPIENVTENYCTSNFDLISPSDCPLSEGTGSTQRSALYLNNIQYAGASNIYLNINDLLDYSTTYIDSGSSFVLDVDGYVADTGYLNDILTVQEYHPNTEDFTTAFVSVMTLGLPYVVVALFVLLIWKLIRKIFKS